MKFCFSNPRNRENAINMLEDELAAACSRYTDFSKCELPSKTAYIVDEITNSYQVDRGLVMLGFFAVVAGLDLGIHIVNIQSIGYKNSLSIFIRAAAESGDGKSKSLQPFFDAIQKIQPRNEEEERIKVKAYKSRYRYLEKEYAKSGNENILTELSNLSNKIKSFEKIPNLLISDITRPALISLIGKQGSVMRIEPDGTTLKENTYDILRKIWSGEGHFEALMSREGNGFTYPHMVDLVYTQPCNLIKFLNDNLAKETGFIARTLCYRANQNRNIINATPKKNIGSQCKEFLHNILERIYLHARDSDGTHITIMPSLDAEREWKSFSNKCEDICIDSVADEIKEWIKRAAQHALRIAGILHLIENDNPDCKLISLEEMHAAIDVIEIVGANMIDCIYGYDNKQKECVCAIGLHILHNNYDIFNETELKQIFKSKYSAKDVDIALDILEMRGYIRTINDKTDNRRGRRGRPRGDNFENLFYRSFILGPLIP